MCVDASGSPCGELDLQGPSRQFEAPGADREIVLLDYRLPDADGIDLLPEFVAHHVPVIMLTGMEEPEMIVGAMQRGAHDYLPKGRLTEEGLEHAIGNAVEKAALRRAVDEQQRALAEHAMELEEKNREVRALASALTLAEQAERRRVSDLLHDNIQQLLFGAKLTLGLLHQSASDTTADSAAFRTHLEEAEQILDEAIDTTRHLAVELTPPVLDREDVAVALRWLAEHMSTMYRVSIDVVTECSCHIPSRELRILVIQIVRELLFNVVKHAGVMHADPSYSPDRQLLVNMAAIQHHRGPDGFGCRLFDGHGVGFSHARLSIIDLDEERARQPFVSGDGRLLLAHNGEFYDYQRIRASLTPGSMVTTLKNTVDHIVTEHGVAEMRGRSLSQRAAALIAIADPRFRDELTVEARSMGYL